MMIVIEELSMINQQLRELRKHVNIRCDPHLVDTIDIIIEIIHTLNSYFERSAPDGK